MAKAFWALVLVMILVGLLAHSCALQSECLESRCASGMEPVWLHRDYECICAERPE